MSCSTSVRDAFRECGRDGDATCLAKHGLHRDASECDRASECKIMGDSQPLYVCGSGQADTVYGVHLFGSPSTLIRR